MMDASQADLVHSGGAAESGTTHWAASSLFNLMQVVVSNLKKKRMN
jgi:hypothetical protein